jgi:hypothetical protein
MRGTPRDGQLTPGLAAAGEAEAWGGVAYWFGLRVLPVRRGNLARRV